MSTGGVRALRVEANGQGGVAVKGAITFDNAGEALRAAPQATRGGDLGVDLSGLVDADSVSLAVLIAWVAQTKAGGAGLRYLNAPQGLRNLARLSDVEGLLGFKD